MPTTMSAMAIRQYHQKQLVKIQVPLPRPSAHEVLVAIHAASINPIDFKTRDGKLRLILKYKMPLILGSDFSGQVVGAGSQVTNFKVGDKVYGRPRKAKIGTFAEYLAIDVDDIALMPSNLSYEEAAALPLVSLTSYQALHDILHLKPGNKILIQAGSGGIGTIAIQLAKQMGAFVATTTSFANKTLVRQLGADQVIDYHREHFETVLSNYDAAFDTLGGDNLERAFKIVKPGGEIVSISGLPTAQFAQDYGLPLWKQLLFRTATTKLRKLEKRYSVSYHFLFMRPSSKQLTIISKLVEQHKIKPVIDEIVPFSQFQQAMAHSEAGHAKGKIIIKIK